MAGKATVGVYLSHYLRQIAKSARALVECEHCSVILFKSLNFSQDQATTFKPIVFFSSQRQVFPTLSLSSYQKFAPSFAGSALLYSFCCCTSSKHHELLALERVRALCDMAMQRESLCYGEFVETWHKQPEIQSPITIVIAPLISPKGLLGFLCFSDSRPVTICTGERRLIEQYLPIVVREVELLLFEGVFTAVKSEIVDDTQPMFPTPEIQEQGDFISMVSHELRIPLTAIKGYVGLLQAYSTLSETSLAVSDEEITPHRQQQYLGAIMEQSNHLETLIGDLMNISRLQAGRLTIRPQRVQLSLLCQHVVQLAQYRIDEQQPESYTIRYYAEENCPEVWADTERVRQVLTNLIENAIKYSPRGGLIEVLVSTQNLSRNLPANPTVLARASSHVSITVRDHGIGIPGHQQHRLFQPFVRLSHPETEKITGAGLGLYVSRKFIEAMSGQITVHSQEGQGTSVTFTLPALLPETPLACASTGNAVNTPFLI